MKHKLFFFDIDGTLAKGREVPQNNKDALLKLRQLGYQTFICTGRSIDYARSLFHDDVDGYIASNGRVGYYQGQIIFDKPLKLSSIERYISLCNKAKCGYLFVDQSHGYLGNQEYIKKETIESIKKDTSIITTWKKEELKVYMFDIFYQDYDHYQQILTIIKDDVIVNDHHGAFSADTTTIGFDKGNGIEEMKAYLNLSNVITYAFGDGSNDACMFRVVDHKIAMANAVEDLKQQATFITKDYLENGIEYALKQLHIF